MVFPTHRAVIQLLFLTSLLTPLVQCTIPLPRTPLDLGNPQQFEQAFKQRVSKENRVILFVFSEREHNHLGLFWWLMTMQIIMQLENRGMLNYIALTDFPELCDQLHERWPLPDDAGIQPSCAFSSEPYNSHNTSYHRGQIADLWATRYYIMAKFAERGVDTLLIDSDSEFHSDIWALLDSPPLKPYHIIGLSENPLNGGTMFVRGTKAHPKGAALWMIREVERQTSLFRDAEFADPEHPYDPGRKDDQRIIGYVLVVAMNAPNSSQWDFRDLYRESVHKDHKFWTEHPQDDATLGRQPDLLFKMTEETYSAPNTTCPVTDEAACARFQNYLVSAELLKRRITYADICVPHDSAYYDAGVPCEKFAFGPNWLWVLGDHGQYGWRTHAVHHLLYIEKFYSKSGSGSHAGRMAWLLARGFVDPRVLVLPPRNDLLVQQPDDEWEKSFLYNSSAHTKFIIKEFVRNATELRKIPVFAPIDCRANWLEDSDKTATGKLDTRVVETLDGTKCYPSPGGYDDCMPHVHFMYDFQLEYYDLGIPFREGAKSMWQPPQDDRFLEECADFLKILDSD